MNSRTIALLLPKMAVPVLAALGSLGFAGTAQAECLTSRIDIPAVADRSAAQSVPLVIEVPARELAGYIVKGFRPAACPSDQAARVKYRDEICRASEFGNEAVQNQLTRYLGERPRKLCGDAETILGAWPGHVRPPSTSGSAGQSDSSPPG